MCECWVGQAEAECYEVQHTCVSVVLARLGQRVMRYSTHVWSVGLARLGQRVMRYSTHV